MAASAVGASAVEGFNAEAAYAVLAQRKMSRTVEARPAAQAEDELAVLRQLLGRCGSEERAVLGEFWEQADEALVATVASEPLDAARARARQGQGAEAQSALQSLAREAAWGLPWPVCEDPGPVCSAPREARAATGARAPRCSAADAAAARPAEPPRSQARGGGFRSASELAPEKPAEAPARRPREPTSLESDFDDVSRSIVGGSRAGATGSSGKRKAEEEWSEEWLRIADAEQLSRIVPALEATIHRPSSPADRVTRRDIAGLAFVKTQIEEVLILPRMHPHLFASALTRPARGLLLFGPPGTGKTLLARWIAAECGATFFNINASSVLSKWIGEAEKTVKALFQLAAERQPSVIFVDEVDSLLSQRRDQDNESSRRVKNEFLTSLEGADTAAGDKVLLVGATNMPWELDQAALRRLPKRLYVPLPGRCARMALLQRQLQMHSEKTGLRGEISEAEMGLVADRTAGFSGSDLQSLLQEAAMGPVREASAALLAGHRGARRRMALSEPTEPRGADRGLPTPRNIRMRDFECALTRVRPSFNPEHAERHHAFNEEHGTCRGEDAMRDDDADDEDMDEDAVREAGG